MNYQEFAKKYLENVGAFDKDTVYGGMLGDSVMALVMAMSGEGHSGNSAMLTNEIFFDLNNAYQGNRKYKDKRHKIWDEYWASPEGQKLQADVGTPGIMYAPQVGTPTQTSIREGNI